MKPGKRDALKTAAYQERHAERGLCRLCPKRRAKNDTRFCRTCRKNERERDRERKRIAADRARGGTAARTNAA
jgi:hypothetical protein